MKHGMTHHPITALFRELRQAAGLSLTDWEQLTHIPAVVMGSYERGDRQPTLGQTDNILRRFGHELAAVPVGALIVPPGDAGAQWVLTGEQMVSMLRHIAAQVEGGQAALVDPVALAALRHKLADGGEAA